MSKVIFLFVWLVLFLIVEVLANMCDNEKVRWLIRLPFILILFIFAIVIANTDNILINILGYVFGGIGIITYIGLTIYKLRD